jgi:hypothetical protein
MMVIAVARCNVGVLSARDRARYLLVSSRASGLPASSQVSMVLVLNLAPMLDHDVDGICQEKFDLSN